MIEDKHQTKRKLMGKSWQQDVKDTTSISQCCSVIAFSDKFVSLPSHKDNRCKEDFFLEFVIEF